MRCIMPEKIHMNKLSGMKSQRIYTLKILSFWIFIGSCVASVLVFKPWKPIWLDIETNDVVRLTPMTTLQQQDPVSSSQDPPRVSPTIISRGKNYIKERMLEIYGIQLDELKERSYEDVEPFTFLPAYKNPCWLEKLPTTYMTEYNNTVYNEFARIQIEEMAKVYDKRLSEFTKPWRLRCLPYFYLLGVTKSGTSDFFDGLMRHPNVHGPWVKEPMYWNRHRYSKCAVVYKNQRCRHQAFSQYLNMFDYPAHIINQSRDDTSGYHNHMIGDGSSYLFWEDNAWDNQLYAENLTVPRFTTPMALHTVQPKAKLIVLFRNPADRVYSAYNMYTGTNNSAHEFDREVRLATRAYKTCFKLHGIGRCAYNSSLSRQLHPISLRASMYHVFLRDWYTAFPKKQILVIKSEDYYADRMRYILAAYKFLGLAPLSQQKAKAISERKTVRVQNYASMLPSTRKHLNDFFRYFTQELYKMLKISWSNTVY